MKSRWEQIVLPAAAGIALAASIGMGGCGRPAAESTPSANPGGAERPSTVTPAAGTRTAVLAVKGMT